MFTSSILCYIQLEKLLLVMSLANSIAVGLLVAASANYYDTLSCFGFLVKWFFISLPTNSVFLLLCLLGPRVHTGSSSILFPFPMGPAGRGRYIKYIGLQRERQHCEKGRLANFNPLPLPRQVIERVS